MRLTPQIEAAIEAYKAGETALAIQARLGVYNAVIYRALRFKNVPLHREQRYGRICPHCWDEIQWPKRRFCSKTCRIAYRLEVAREQGLVAECPNCNKELWPVRNRIYCSKDCITVSRQKRRDVKIAKVKQRLALGFTIVEIASELGCAANTLSKLLMRSRPARRAKALDSWTAERFENAKMLWLTGATYSAIANELGGTSRQAVAGKLTRHGFIRKRVAAPFGGAAT